MSDPVNLSLGMVHLIGAEPTLLPVAPDDDWAIKVLESGGGGDANGTTRHLCPLACGWHHDEPAPGLDDFAGIAPDPAATTLAEMSNSIVEQATLRRARATEAVLRAHFATHGIHTADQLRALLAA